MKVRSVLLRTGIIGWFAVLLSACVPALDEMKGPGEAGPNDILIVGKVELIPKLQKNEQNLRGIGTGKFKNRFGLIFAEKKPSYKKGSESGTTYKQFDNYALVEPGKTFIVRYPKGKPIYYLGGIIYLSTSGSIDTLKIPGGIRYLPGKNAHAVYLGTIRYRRDDYNAITKVQLINQISQAKRDLRKTLGRDVPLQKVKPTGFKMRALDF